MLQGTALCVVSCGLSLQLARAGGAGLGIVAKGRARRGWAPGKVTIGEPVGALKVRAGWSAQAPYTSCCQIGARMAAPKISPP